ncbi:probable cyclic nucleotide-gated ion channel 16 [Mercurialis annua]|uniref:probable cyclic nucleotide-gated ion channel 16 n=1 Tax=Mercurialis annua TaxID=3986 RepID=UPI0021601C85|nr:probable cyclic nucleotide-gated ion channel 16 [Mercurialis annua]
MNNLHSYTSARFGRFPSKFSLTKKVRWWDQILDPRSNFINSWNYIFLVTCMIALFLDPLYFFLPIIGGDACMEIDYKLGIYVTLARTVTDMFFLIHVVIKFRTAFVAPSSRVFGRGELVMDPKAIAVRYLKSQFALDLFAALPLPQTITWMTIPGKRTPTANHANHSVSLIVLIQYIPRFFVMLPLNRRIVKSTGMVAKTAWSGAAYNLLLYVLASHILGASWYVASIQRQFKCWTKQCYRERNHTHSPSCSNVFLDCNSKNNPARIAWFRTTSLLTNCDAKNDTSFAFGIFADAFTNHVAEAHFVNKYFYCLWWGLRNLSSYGQNLMTTTYEGELLFSIGICIMGLVLFAHLIGNMQTYMQSTTARLEEWRIRRRDTEEWMRHRQLPLELQERVRRFVQYKWLATRGVDEESILKALPLDIRRQIRRHLCLALVRRVPFFAQMDDQLLDAICERLVSSLNTRDTFIVREGDPVNEMLFIIRGQLESTTTNGGRTGFFNSITLRAGDFCGEELLTWALIPTSRLNRPSSTRTVKALSEVEAFALRAEDLKFVAKQFKRLHSKRLQHAFRYYSHQWRTWGACYIQTAWRRHMRRQLQMELARQESLFYDAGADGEGGGDGNEGDRSSSDFHGSNTQNLGVTILASKFAANTRRGMLTPKHHDDSTLKMPKFFKPEEPNFFEEHEDS